MKRLERMANILDKVFRFVMFMFALYLLLTLIHLITIFNNTRKITQLERNNFMQVFFIFLGVLLFISFLHCIVVEKIKKKSKKNFWLN